MKVRFKPTGTSAGARQAQLVVGSSDLSGQDTIFLSGTATGYPTLRVTPDLVDFGSVPAGSSSSQRKLIVRNIDASPVTIGTSGLAGTDPASSRSPATRAPGRRCRRVPRARCASGSVPPARRSRPRSRA